MRRKIVISAALLIAALAVGGGLAATHRFPFERSAPSPAGCDPTVPVVAGVVAQHDVPIYLTGVGTVIAYNTVVVHSQIQGQIVSINFTEGQTVHAGDLLAQIDPRPIRRRSTNDREPRSRSGPARERSGQSRPLHDAGGQGLGHAAAPRYSEGASRATAECHQSRRSAHRRCEGPTQLHAADVADRRRDRHSSDRHWQHHSSDRRQRARGRHADRADFADIHASGDGSAANSAAAAKTKAPLTVFAYSQDNKIKLDEGTLGLVNNEILQTTGSIQLKANFPNKDASALAGRAYQRAAAARYAA